MSTCAGYVGAHFVSGWGKRAIILTVYGDAEDVKTAQRSFPMVAGGVIVINVPAVSGCLIPRPKCTQ